CRARRPVRRCPRCRGRLALGRDIEGVAEPAVAPHPGAARGNAHRARDGGSEPAGVADADCNRGAGRCAMRRLAAIVVLLSAALPAFAQASGLDELLEQIRKSQSESTRINQEREQRFLRNKTEQAELLRQAERELASAKSRADVVRGRYDAQ